MSLNLLSLPHGVHFLGFPVTAWCIPSLSDNVYYAAVCLSFQRLVSGILLPMHVMGMCVVLQCIPNGEGVVIFQIHRDAPHHSVTRRGQPMALVSVMFSRDTVPSASGLRHDFRQAI